MKWIFLFLSLLFYFGCGPIEHQYRGIYIYSVTATPTSQEQVTLENDSIEDVDISRWTIGDLNDPWAYNIPNNTIMPAQTRHQFMASTMGFQINDQDEVIYLKNNSGTTIDTWKN